MRKYGFDHFSFQIVEDNITNRDMLDEREKYYISNYHSLCSENGYNIELGGNGRGKHSEETKKKISESQKKEKNHMYGQVGKLNATSKPIIDLTTGKIYESANLASIELNLSPSHICSSARGDRGSTGGHVFRYLDSQNNIILPDKIANIKDKKTKNSVLKQFKDFI